MSLKNFYLLIVFFSFGTVSHAQTTLHWSDLSEGISWSLPSPDAIFPGFEKATFSPRMKALEGQQVIITGYLLVLDAEQSVFLLSKNPMASCFFCGNGGPETVLDLQFPQPPSFEMDEVITVEGTFYLNENNPNASYYKIGNADAISFK